MKKYLRRIVLSSLCFIMIFTVVAIDPTSVMAKVSMPAKSGTLVNRISDFTTLYIVDHPQKSWTKISINNDTIMKATDLIICDYENKYCFDSEKQIYNLCYKYFGKSGYKDVTRGNHFYYLDGKIYNYGGDWGMSWPECRIVKKKEVKTGVYDVYVTNYMRYDKDALEEGEKDLEKAGESIVRIKKNKKSAFGYAVIGMKYKTTDNKWF